MMSPPLTWMVGLPGTFSVLPLLSMATNGGEPIGCVAFTRLSRLRRVSTTGKPQRSGEALYSSRSEQNARGMVRQRPHRHSRPRPALSGDSRINSCHDGIHHETGRRRTIAALALENGAEVHTNNARDFQRFPGLL